MNMMISTIVVAMVAARVAPSCCRDMSVRAISRMAMAQVITASSIRPMTASLLVAPLANSAALKTADLRLPRFSMVAATALSIPLSTTMMFRACMT